MPGEGNALNRPLAQSDRALKNRFFFRQGRYVQGGTSSLFVETNSIFSAAPGKIQARACDWNLAFFHER
jgi:hypothetical protein